MLLLNFLIRAQKWESTTKNFFLGSIYFGGTFLLLEHLKIGYVYAPGEQLQQQQKQFLILKCKI